MDAEDPAMPRYPHAIRWSAVALVSAALAAAVQARPPEGRPVEPGLRERLEHLERQLAELQARSADRWMDEARSEAIAALAREVAADAAGRAALLDTDGVHAGYDDAFFLASADGLFRLEVGGRIQTRFVWSHQDAGDDRDRSGFEMRRVKLDFDGRVHSTRFAITGAFDRSSGAMKLDDATIEQEVAPGLTARVGRFRSSLLREEAVSSRRQLAVERSLVARTFDQDRTIGIGLRAEADALRATMALMDAGGPGALADDNVQGSLRLEWMPVGRWKEARSFTGFVDDDPAVLLGAGILYRDIEEEDDDDDGQLVRWTLDAGFAGNGMNAFAALVGSHPDEAEDRARDQLGAVVQGGVFVAEELELFARYEWGDADGLAADLSVLTVGFNRYFRGHDLKWTSDIGFGFNPVEDFWASDGAGWREDPEGEDGQIVVRSQVQIVF